VSAIVSYLALVGVGPATVLHQGIGNQVGRDRSIDKN
jgi:hypothetical protein